MRLLTHNMLQCPRSKQYPLRLRAATCDEVEVEFNGAFVRRMAGRLDWGVFLEAARQLPDPETNALLPKEAPPDDADDAVWRAVHRMLLEWHVVDGSLDADAGNSYAIRNGVPNLVITEVRKDADGAAGNADDDDGDDDGDGDRRME